MEINKIYQGDCLELMKQIDDESVDLVITSPPYNIGIDYDSWNDDVDWEKYYSWCKEWMKEIYRVLKIDGRFCLNHYLCLGTAKARHSPLMELNQIAVKEIGFKHHAVCVWTDRTLTKRTAWGSWKSASAPYINTPYEGILILYKQDWKKHRKGVSTISKDKFMELCSGVWNMQPERKGLTKANFPIELPSNCINLLSYEEDVVLDPFMGSGTTAVACKQLNRNFIGFEISESYCKIAEKRLKPYLEQTKLNKVL